MLRKFPHSDEVFMKAFVLIGLFFVASHSMANNCKVDLGIYVTDDEYSPDSKCAYLITKYFSDQQGCGVSVSFIHDPRFLPKYVCDSNGITNYPIGVDLNSKSSFYDVRTNRLFKFYGSTNLNHEDLFSTEQDQY